MKAILLSLALTPLAVSPADPRARPDIIPEGMRSVEHALTFDAGPLASCLCRSYVIAKGDTFDAIARRECGDVRCGEEIRLLNPGVKPEALQPGTRIVIPPRRAAAVGSAESRGGTRTCWILFQDLRGQSRRAVPVLEGRPLEDSRWGSRLIAVARDRLAWFLDYHDRNASDANASDGVAYSERFSSTRVIPAGDPAVKVETRIVLEGVEDGRVLFERKERRFGKGKDLVAPPWDQDGRVTPRSDSLALPLSILGVGALLGIIVLARRRRAGPDRAT